MRLIAANIRSCKNCKQEQRMAYEYIITAITPLEQVYEYCDRHKGRKWPCGSNWSRAVIHMLISGMFVLFYYVAIVNEYRIQGPTTVLSIPIYKLWDIRSAGCRKPLQSSVVRECGICSDTTSFNPNRATMFRRKYHPSISKRWH
jgi:hypothetical protein